MLVDIFRESIQSTHLFINTWTQQLIKCKLLPSICSQLYVVRYGEIGSWTLVWFKVCLTTDSPSIVPTFCSGQVGRINVIDTSVRMICAESSWRTFRVSNNLNDFFSSIGLSFSFFIRSWATAQRTLFVSFQLHQPSSFPGPFPCSAPLLAGGGLGTRMATNLRRLASTWDELSGLWAQIRIQDDEVFDRLAIQSKSTQVDALRLFESCVNLRADLRIRLTTHRESVRN